MEVVDLSVELLHMTPEPLRLIERSGRVCYKSEDKITGDSAEAFVRKIISRGHESVLEHAYASFLIVCNRGVSHEAVRHRIAAYSQESTRYCNYGGGVKFVRPFDLTPAAEVIWKSACRFAERAYDELIDLGCPPQVARDVLPICTKTELVWSANFREWRHILKLRTSKAAHPQIQWICGQIKEFFPPVIVEDIQ